MPAGEKLLTRLSHASWCLSCYRRLVIWMLGFVSTRNLVPLSVPLPCHSQSLGVSHAKTLVQMDFAPQFH